MKNKSVSPIAPWMSLWTPWMLAPMFPAVMTGMVIFSMPRYPIKK